MQFLTIRCLACQNLDSFPRLDYDEIPYCSQCASTTDLAPEPPIPQKMSSTTSPTSAEDLITLFNQHLYLSAPLAPPQQQQATPPLSPAANFSISQHYHHSAHPLSPAPSSSSGYDEEMSDSSTAADREYAQYLLASDLSSPHSLNELEIALAHGVIGDQEYAEAARRYLDRQAGKALAETCSAAEMMGATERERGRERERERERERGRREEWCNEYYGQLDMDEDEERPCQVYVPGLRPFEL